MITLAIAHSIAVMTLSRPPVNAISNDLISQFAAKLDEIGARPDCKVVHLRSGQKVFCAGADLTEVRRRFDSPNGDVETLDYVTRLQALFSRLECLPQVTLAEIGGAAIGGGFELALACDFRVIASEAKVGLPEARLGLIPGGGGTQRLTRLCGRATATRLILGAEVLDGAAAVALGLGQWSVAENEIPKRAGEIARGLAALPAEALFGAKKCIAAAAEPGDGGYLAERDETRRLSANPETRERVAAFLAGRMR